MTDFYAGRRVYVAGGTGLIGSHVVEELVKRGADVRFSVHRRPSPFEVVERWAEPYANFDLQRSQDCNQAVAGMNVVFNCAGLSGGMGRMARDPMPMFEVPLLINTQLLAAARRAGVEYYALASNASVYPDMDYPAHEMHGTRGPGSENVAGNAKRIMEHQCDIYNAEAALKVAIVRGGAAYGPRDYFDAENSHVIPSLVARAVARQDPFEIWGDGTPTRDFTHARDIARGLLWAVETLPYCRPVNIATGVATSIKQAATTALWAAGHDTLIKTGSRERNGTQVKLLDVFLARGLGFECKTTLADGMKETVEWYRAHNVSAG
jgi:GDP-L-fucose synthase